MSKVAIPDLYAQLDETFTDGYVLVRVAKDGKKVSYDTRLHGLSLYDACLAQAYMGSSICNFLADAKNE